MKASGNYVILDLLEVPKQNSLIIPTAVEMPCNYGKVLSSGKEAQEEFDIKKGDIACFVKSGAVKMPRGPGSKSPVYVITAPGIFAVLDEGEKKCFDRGRVIA